MTTQGTMHFAAYYPISANIILSDDNDSRIRCDHNARNSKTPIITISNDLQNPMAWGGGGV